MDRNNNENITNKLLKQYNTKTTEINLLNRNIIGILDLKKFKKLKILICSNNQITQIINLPEGLIHLECDNNNITCLYLSNNFEIVNCEGNPIEKLIYDINIRPDKYPDTLRYLTLGENFNQNINNLPNTTTHLTLNMIKYKYINKLPVSITHLTLGENFNQEINNLSSSIKKINIHNINQLKSLNKKYHKLIKNIYLSKKNIVELRTFNYTNSNIKHCFVNNNEIQKLNYANIIKEIYKIIDNGSTIIKNTKLNIETFKKTDQKYHYLNAIGISVQINNVNDSIREIINQCIKNNINLNMKIKLSDKSNPGYNDVNININI